MPPSIGRRGCSVRRSADARAGVAGPTASRNSAIPAIDAASRFDADRVALGWTFAVARLTD